MLPFLKEKKEASVSLPEDVITRDSDEDKEFDSIEEAFKDLCNAVESKDYRAGAEALRAAFELLEAEPHAEGPHTEE